MDGVSESLCHTLLRVPTGQGCEGPAAMREFLLSLQAQLLPFGCSPGCCREPTKLFLLAEMN